MGHVSRRDAGVGLDASDDSQARVASAAHRLLVSGGDRELVAVGVSEGSPGNPLVRWLGELLAEDPNVALLEKGEPSDGASRVVGSRSGSTRRWWPTIT